MGRSTEIERLRSLVRRSARGTLGVGFVTGERGIGKSSLAAFVRHLAEHDSDAVGCHVYVGGVDEVPEMLRRTFHRLLNESIDKPWHQQLTSFLGNRIEKAGLFGTARPDFVYDNTDDRFAVSVLRLASTPAPRRRPRCPA